MAAERMTDPEWDERFTESVTAQRAAQGLPAQIEDPETIEAVAAIFRDAHRDRAHNTRESA